MNTLRESRISVRETNRSLCRDPYISSPKNTVCALADHQPVNHQEIERVDIGEITEAITVNTVKAKEHCAHTIISELEDQRAQITSPESNTAVFEVEKEHFDVDVRHSTKRIMVPRRVDKRFPNRFPGRPRSSRQRYILTVLGKTCRNRRYTYAYEGYADRVGSCQQIRYESTLGCAT